MGVHQYHISLLPRAYFESEIPAIITDAELDVVESKEFGWWTKGQPDQNSLNRLRGLLPYDKSWGEVEQYNSKGEWCSDLRIWKRNGRVWGIDFRFSPSVDDWELMNRFLKVAREEKCVLREHRTGAVFEPHEDIVLERMNRSLAMRFVRDPASAVIQAAKEICDRSSEK